ARRQVEIGGSSSVSGFHPIGIGTQELIPVLIVGGRSEIKGGKLQREYVLTVREGDAAGRLHGLSEQLSGGVGAGEFVVDPQIGDIHRRLKISGYQFVGIKRID